MKTNAIHPVLIFILLVTVSSPMLVQAESAINSQAVNVTNTIANKHKTPQAGYEAAAIEKNHKKILIKDSREMSPFFKLGIAINVVMVFVFGWWFSKEWRRKK